MWAAPSTRHSGNPEGGYRCKLTVLAGGERESEAHSRQGLWASSRLRLELRWAKPRRASHSHTVLARPRLGSGDSCARPTWREPMEPRSPWRGSTNVPRQRVRSPVGCQSMTGGSARPAHAIRSRCCGVAPMEVTSPCTRWALRPTGATGSRQRQGSPILGRLHPSRPGGCGWGRGSRPRPRRPRARAAYAMLASTRARRGHDTRPKGAGSSLRRGCWASRQASTSERPRP